MCNYILIIGLGAIIKIIGVPWLRKNIVRAMFTLYYIKETYKSIIIKLKGGAQSSSFG